MKWTRSIGLVAALAVVTGLGGAALASVLPSSTTSVGRTADTGKVMFVYATASDGAFRYGLDTVANGAQRADELMGVRTGGYGLRVDRDAQGRPVVAQVRLLHTAAEIAGAGGWATNVIGSDLAALGFPAGNLYAVYYDGGLSGSCGFANAHAEGSGKVAVQETGRCAADFASYADLGYGPAHYGMLHEVYHAMGLVKSSAPHYTNAGCGQDATYCHVGDDPHDLLYTGPGGAILYAVLDTDRQDYWWDLIGSPFVVGGAYYKLGVNVQGSGGVTVEPAALLKPDPAACDSFAPCENLWYSSRRSVTLKAEGITGFFGGWGGACSGRGTCEVAMTTDRQVTATFVPPTVLRVKLIKQRVGKMRGNGRVVIVGQDPCRQATCRYDLERGSAIRLIAKSSRGSRFVGWRAAAKHCKAKLRCLVKMRGNRTVVAVFTRTRR